MTVFRKGSDHLIPAKSEDEAGEILALWSAVIEGVGWIEAACAAGDATLLQDGWYPSVFTMPARVLAGVIVRYGTRFLPHPTSTVGRHGDS